MFVINYNVLIISILALRQEVLPQCRAKLVNPYVTIHLADATKALVLGYNKFKETLEYISKDPEQKEVVKNEANGLLKKITSFKIALYLLFCNDILDRFNATNHLLQNPMMILQSAITALTSLKLFVQDKRKSFEEYGETAKKNDKDVYTTLRKSLQLRKNDPLPFLKNGKRELFPVDNWDEDSHDLTPLQSSPEAYDHGLDTSDSSFNMNCTPITELSSTMSDTFERLMSGPKNGHKCSATIVIEETPKSRRIKMLTQLHNTF
ncbi:hypothetical protein QTP88_012704 [Uroleucon formosanum]